MVVQRQRQRQQRQQQQQHQIKEVDLIQHNMKYILAQPAINYYSWQIEVSINSIIENKVQPGDIHIVSGIQNGSIPESFSKLQERFPDVVWSFYHDNRSERQREYVPSIRPHIMKKHWRKHPELQDEVIFYMEADTLITKPINQKFKLSKKWYLSDTISYIGHDYIVDRDPRFLDLFCGIVKIDSEVVKANQDGSGGAQYIMKDLTEQYWEKVEHDCVEIYHQGSELINTIKAEDPDWHPIQIWTSCMWSHLWNGWLLGSETECPKEMDFTWATDPKSHLDDRSIYHNAGVTKDHNDVLNKADYIHELPYDKKINIDQSKAGAWYYAKVQQVGKTSCLK